MYDKTTPLHTLIQALQEAKALEITSIDVRQQTCITDAMVICTGRSSRHVKSIAQAAIETMKKTGLLALSQTGLLTGDWALVDFGDLVLHIMQAHSRSFYHLEDHWQSTAA